jgi:hypothetical protein
MQDRKLLKRLPYHAETPQIPAFQVQRLLNKGLVLGVITKGERGMNLWPTRKTSMV